MKVLQVLEATIGGTKRHMLDLVAGLRDAGIEVEVACPRVRDEHHGDVSFWDDLAHIGVRAHAVPMRRRPANATNLAALPRLVSLIASGRYDVVHAQSSMAGVLARPAAWLAAPFVGRRPRTVYSPHGFAFLSDEWGQHRRVFTTVERTLGRLTDRLIAVSATEASQAAASGVIPRSRVAVVPNGVVSSQFPATRHRISDLVPDLTTWDDAPLIGTLARMLPQKDPLTWVRVAAAVARERPDARFIWIWGGGAEANAVEAEVRQLGLADKIRFLGHRSDARQLFAAMDVFLLTSRFEGLPYSVVEALACGTPVVATDVDGTRDVVRAGVSGLLAPTGDVQTLASHVLRLLAEPEAATQLGAAGRSDVLEKFSIERMVERTIDVYRSTL
jgi:glycosyltransferase involved in cell wall biosynthesis